MSFNVGTLAITSGNDTSFQVPNDGVKAILIGNESGLTVTITMESGGVQKTLYPSSLDWFSVKKGFSGRIKIHPVTVLNNVAAWPASSLIFDAVGIHDPEQASMYPVPIPRVANTGNSQALTSSNAIVDDGRVAGSKTIESTVGTNVFSSVVITNDGKLTIKDTNGNIVLAYDLTAIQLNPPVTTKNGATAGSISMYPVSDGTIKVTVFTCTTNLNQGTTAIDFTLPVAHTVGAIIVTSLPWQGVSVLLASVVQATVHDIAHVGAGGTTSIVPGQAIQTIVGAFDTVRFIATAGAAPTGGIFLVIGI